jgi:hypothetical protein
MAWREEPWWHWDWPGRPAQHLQPGNGGHNLSEGAQPGSVAARIFIPDPEERGGWANYWVYRDAPAPQKPGMGFR